MLAKLALIFGLCTFGSLAWNPSTALRRSAPDLKSVLSDPVHTWCSGTEVYYPDQANYKSLTTQRWTSFEAPSYLASIKPACAQDVATVVKLCVSLNIPFLATGGGHGYSTSFGKLQNGLELDLGGFRDINIDQAAKTMTVGGAVTFGEVYDPLYALGLEIPTGSCTCVGFVGGTLGGGVGRFQGIHGLLIDSLISVDLITAAGDQITVSATENAELFWGIRGAGMNFGVVTSATYHVFDSTNSGEIQDADLIFSAAQNVSFFETFASLEGALPPELSLLAYIDWNVTNGGTEILLNIVYPGPMDSFMELIKIFLDLKPVVQIIRTIPHNLILVEAGFGLVSGVCKKEMQHSLYSVGTKHLSSPDYISAFSRYNDLYLTYPETRASTLEIEFFPNQAVVAVPLASTAYPWRDIEAQMMFQMQFTGSPTGPAANAANALGAELRTAFTATSGYDQLEVYVSYAHGDEDPVTYYGEFNLPKLQALKKLWDLTNAFQYDNSIPMTS